MPDATPYMEEVGETDEDAQEWDGRAGQGSEEQQEKRDKRDGKGAKGKPSRAKGKGDPEKADGGSESQRDQRDQQSPPDPQNCEGRHRLYPLVLKILQAGVPLYLVGPAGSGKTTVVEQASAALGLSFNPKSCGPTMAEHDLIGYMNGHGHYVPGVVRVPFTDGGVLCLDELDNANPTVVTVLNSMIANGYMSFPDAILPRHPECRIVACGNTWGQGGSKGYQRMALDAATLDRFAFLEFPYDEALEAYVVGVEEQQDRLEILRGGDLSAEQWLKLVRTARAALLELGIQQVLSPRASIMGSKLLTAGVGAEWCMEMLIYKGLASDQRERVNEKMAETLRKTDG